MNVKVACVWAFVKTYHLLVDIFRICEVYSSIEFYIAYGEGCRIKWSYKQIKLPHKWFIQGSFKMSQLHWLINRFWSQSAQHTMRKLLTCEVKYINHDCRNTWRLETVIQHTPTKYFHLLIDMFCHTQYHDSAFHCFRSWYAPSRDPDISDNLNVLSMVLH